MDFQKDVWHFSFSGFIIEISFNKIEWQSAKERLQKDILFYYKGFILKTKPKKIDFWIDVVQNNNSIIYRKNNLNFINFYEVVTENKIITNQQINTTQLSIIIRNIIEKLFKGKGFIIHASAVRINEEAIIFVGNSGAGKSTAMTLLSKRYIPLADDSIIIRNENNVFYAYQSPLVEKNMWFFRGCNKYPVKAIFFLKKAQFFKIKKITDKHLVLEELIEQFWTEEDYLKKQLDYLLDFINKNDKFYFLYFAKDKERLFNFLKNDFL